MSLTQPALIGARTIFRRTPVQPCAAEAKPHIIQSNRRDTIDFRRRSQAQPNPGLAVALAGT
jgi:hypothetical protein